MGLRRSWPTRWAVFPCASQIGRSSFAVAPPGDTALGRLTLLISLVEHHLGTKQAPGALPTATRTLCDGRFRSE